MSYLPVALDGVWGVDTAHKLSSSDIQALSTATVLGRPIRAVCRYVFFGPPKGGDIDEQELQRIRSAGLVLWLAQHCRSGSWVASGPLGAADGQWAVRNALGAGYGPVAGAPPPALCLDLESVRNPGPDAVAHALQWRDVVALAGFRPVVYIGFDAGLTLSEQALLGVPLWSDFGPRSPPPGRGFAGKQHPQCVVRGIGVDPDEFHADLMGEAIYGMGEADAHVDGQDTEMPEVIA